ncbi:hypothetical protein K504DRAFT_463634 [Pleomassaria siparia CBS 279.74]|uniref:Ubiquitin 3 binding protein But2 C-terminal domain-containing protein n=1 Tax=Pleomassaria siparia CBS 279.74 TaxID=1314801 RepID=A0A6G1JSV4_9PLEO|nr:hypothetical protein K504DRAFT_463634 [Pleomassaria siparia CBS 279.74]
MFSAITIAFGLIASVSAVAIPTPQAPTVFADVTFSLTNDITGANAKATIPGNGVDVSFEHLFLGTSIAPNNEIYATSIQFVTLPPNVSSSCIFVIEGREVVINDKQTFGDIDGNPWAAIPQKLNGLTINCRTDAVVV